MKNDKTPAPAPQPNPLDLFTFAPAAVKLDNGNTVHVRRLTAVDRAKWLDGVSQGNVTAEVSLNDQARIVACTACREDGTLLFADVEQAKQIDCLTLDTMVKHAMRLNGLGKEGEDEVAGKPEPSADTPAS